ncbi:MAG: energy-coupling factor transporter transmembrane component T family protein [Anaerolineaceae bacterium]
MAIEYQKGTSQLHRLDARTKLLMFVGFTIAAVVIVDPILMAIIFLSLYWLGTQAVDRQLLNQNLKVLVMVFLTFSLFQILFFTPKDSHFLFYLIPFTEYVPVTIQGLVRGMAVFFRFFSVVLSVHLMLYSTPPVELALTITERGERKFSRGELLVTAAIGLVIFISALPSLANGSNSINFLSSLSPISQNLIIVVGSLIVAFLIQKIVGRGLPPEMGVALMLGFSTVGILTKQTQKITDAQKARGYDVAPKNVFQRVKVLTALLIPIFLATMERSQDISVAILSRGFDYNISKRTFRREFKFKRNDYLFMSVMLTIIIGGMLMNYFGVGNFTEQAILKLIG